MATADEQRQVVDALKDALRRAGDKYVDVRNAASAKQWAAARPEIERRVAERKKADEEEEKTLFGVVGTVASAINAIPVAGQIISAVIVIGAALAKAAADLARVYGKVHRDPPPPLPSREGYETYRGFDREAWLWLHQDELDAERDSASVFANLVDRRLWAMSQLTGIDFLIEFPIRARGQVVPRPYLFDALPEVSEFDAAAAAAAREGADSQTPPSADAWQIVDPTSARLGRAVRW